MHSGPLLSISFSHRNAAEKIYKKPAGKWKGGWGVGQGHLKNRDLE
jgi:hypothetical protein